MSPRTGAAAIIGLVAGVAAIVGTVLPWLSISMPGGSGSGLVSPEQTTTLDGLTLASGFFIFLGVGIAIAGGWLWAGDAPRKPAVVLGALAFAVGTVCVWMAISKEEGLGFGSFGGSAGLEPGVFVTLGAAIVGLVAAVIAVLPERVHAVEEPNAVSDEAH